MCDGNFTSRGESQGFLLLVSLVSFDCRSEGVEVAPARPRAISLY